LVWELLKTINGIKQGPRRWHLMLKELMAKHGGVPCKTDPSVYVFKCPSYRTLIISTWVDDLWYYFDKKDEERYRVIERAIRGLFNGMKEAVELHALLGMRVRRNRNARTLTIDQQAYTEELMKKMNLQHAKATVSPAIDKNLCKADSAATAEEKAELGNVPYQEAVGSLIWLSSQTRPDIAFPVSVLTRFMSNPGRKHWEAAKRVLRYLKGTANAKLTYRRRSNQSGLCVIEGYCDADWAADIDTRRSTTGYTILLNGNVVAWGSKKQKTVAMSTAEAEYMGMSAATEEFMWMRQFLEEIGLKYEKPIILRTDNTTARIIATGEVSSTRTKHIDIRYHQVRDEIERGDIRVEWVSTEKQLADILTKCLPTPRFLELRTMLGIQI
jgi:hypothetical protein